MEKAKKKIKHSSRYKEINAKRAKASSVRRTNGGENAEIDEPTETVQDAPEIPENTVKNESRNSSVFEEANQFH